MGAPIGGYKPKTVPDCECWATSGEGIQRCDESTPSTKIQQCDQDGAPDGGPVWNTFQECEAKCVGAQSISTGMCVVENDLPSCQVVACPGNDIDPSAGDIFGAGDFMESATYCWEFNGGPNCVTFEIYKAMAGF